MTVFTPGTLALKANPILSQHTNTDVPAQTITTTTTTNDTAPAPDPDPLPLLPPLPKDCLGIPGGSAHLDCMHVCGGTAVIDDCGTCGGHNEACADCLGVLNGHARPDKCGVCNGPNACLDCQGIPWGNGQLDRCGVCEGDGKSCIGCDRVLFSGKKVDKCGVCGGNNSCVDCNGVPFGFSKLDRCGVCDGKGVCVGCDGVAHSNLRVDACGVCGGDGTTCSGCDGIPGSKILLDACGVCGGDNSTCCAPSPFATAVTTTVYSDALQQKMDELLGPNTGRRNQKKPAPGGPKHQNTILCNGQGWCDPTIRGCFCDSGWTGPYCQKKQTLCRPSHTDVSGMECHGRGACDVETGVCVCVGDWTGFSCDISLCRGNGAFDVDVQKCVCYMGFVGEFCEQCAQPDNFPQSEYVCVPRSYSSSKLQSLVASSLASSSSLEHDAVIAEQLSEASRTYDLMAISQSRVEALVHKSKSTDKAFRPNSTLDGGGDQRLDCSCRVSILRNTAILLDSSQTAITTKKEGDDSENRRKLGGGGGATVAAHNMVRDLMTAHAEQVRRSTAQLQAVNDMSQSSSSSLELATTVCIAFTTIAWIVVLVTMGIVVLTALVLARIESGGIQAGLSVLTAGARFGRRNKQNV